MCGPGIPQKDCMIRTHQLAHSHRLSVDIVEYGQCWPGPHQQNYTTPPITGTGANATVSDWTLFDSFLGPLFDGSAFTDEWGYEGPGYGTAEYYARIAEAFYQENPIFLINRYREYVVWKWQDGKLTFRDVPRYRWNEEVAEEYAHDGLSVAPDDQVLDTLLREGGWLSRTSVGWLPVSYLRTMPAYYRGVDPVIDHDRGIPPGMIAHSSTKPQMPTVQWYEPVDPVEIAKPAPLQ